MAGQMVHVEIPAGDTAKAREFWGGLFGWQFEEYPGSPTEYHMTRFSETQGGAISGAEETSVARASTSTSTTSKCRRRRLASSAARAASPCPCRAWAGSRLCTDTEGNEFGLWETDPNASMPGA